MKPRPAGSQVIAMNTTTGSNPARRFVVVAAVAAAAVMFGGCSHNSSATSKHREARVFHVPAAGVETLDIRSEKGRVDIAEHGEEVPGWATRELSTAADTADGEILVIAIVQSDEKKRLAKATLTPRVEDGALRLKADWPMSLSNDDGDGVEYVIRGPSIRHVNADTAFGDLRIIGARGLVNIDTGFGDIRLDEQHGPVQADTGFGDIRVTFTGEHGTRSILESGFGDIRATNVSGPLKAHSGFGDIEVGLTDDNAGPVEADSGFGDVRIDAGPAFSGRATPSSGFGKARVVHKNRDQEKQQSKVSTGFGDATVTIRDGG